jgi:hypothetical protein
MHQQHTRLALPAFHCLGSSQSLRNQLNKEERVGIVKITNQMLFSIRHDCSRKQRKRRLDWLVTNNDDISSQSHSIFACSREKSRQEGENDFFCANKQKVNVIG